MPSFPPPPASGDVYSYIGPGTPNPGWLGVQVGWATLTQILGIYSRNMWGDIHAAITAPIR